MSLIDRKLAAAIRKAARKANINSLLSIPEANPKIAKNGKVGIYTAPLHMIPAKLSGFEVCGGRTEGCTKACLHTAGAVLYIAQKIRGRMVRTKLFFNKQVLLTFNNVQYTGRDIFMMLLVLEIERHVKRADVLDMAVGVRLNATSDIPYESIKVRHLNAANIMELFPNVSFYDYTKLVRKNLPSNYDLTFSLAEDNDDKAIAALDAGLNVAVVFDKLPETFTLGNRTLPVVNGDEHDYRPLDARCSIIGLKAKGKAKQDTSGFVRRTKVVMLRMVA